MFMMLSGHGRGRLGLLPHSGWVHAVLRPTSHLRVRVVLLAHMEPDGYSQYDQVGIHDTHLHFRARQPSLRRCADHEGSYSRPCCRWYRRRRYRRLQYAVVALLSFPGAHGMCFQFSPSWHKLLALSRSAFLSLSLPRIVANSSTASSAVRHVRRSIRYIECGWPPARRCIH
jgi:hypothetical protein